MRKYFIMIPLIQLFLFPSFALCCSCDTPPPPEIALAKFDYVFAGRVIDFEPVFERLKQSGRDTIMVSTASTDMVRWSVSVSYIWKGSIQDTVEIYSSMNGSSCGFQFEVGEMYLIYGRIIEKCEGRWKYPKWPENTVFPVIETNLCTRTKSWDAAEEDISALPNPLYERKNY